VSTAPGLPVEARFPADVLARLEAEEEVDIETRRGDGRIRSTIVWVMVEDGRAYLRSVRGPEGRWYQEARVEPRTVIVAGGRRIAVRCVHAPDPVSVAACSDALRRKYRGDPSLRAMLARDVLATTLRLEPRDAGEARGS